MAEAKSSGLSKPLNLSAELEAVVGAGPMSRTDITKKIWEYIKSNNLQDPQNKKNINADEKLKKVFGADTVGMMQIAGFISKHVKPV